MSGGSDGAAIRRNRPGYQCRRVLRMIEVTRLDGKMYYINPHQIEYMESNPDTTLTMLSGKRLVVKDDVETVIDRIVEYRKRIGAFKNEE